MSSHVHSHIPLTVTVNLLTFKYPDLSLGKKRTGGGEREEKKERLGKEVKKEGEGGMNEGKKERKENGKERKRKERTCVHISITSPYFLSM